MKNKIAIASAFIAASSFSVAEIALTESLSVEGFVAAGYTDSSATNASFDLNEVELSFIFDAGGVSARVDTQYVALPFAGQNISLGNIDQAFISYDVFGGTLSAGLMDSQLGFEAFEAPGLYTNSLAYGQPAQRGADEAVNFTMQLDEVSSVGVSFINGDINNNNIVNSSFIGDLGSDDAIIEVAYGRDLGNGFGAHVGTRSDGAGNDLATGYITYETGAFLFAVEYIDDEAADADSYQLFANYAYADNASVTVRYCSVEGGLLLGGDADILTLAHQLALADSLMLTTEYTDNGEDDNEHEFSVGLLFTF
jgi:hypothetical protein